jgi:hypothetical protein
MLDPADRSERTAQPLTHPTLTANTSAASRPEVPFPPSPMRSARNPPEPPPGPSPRHSLHNGGTPPFTPSAGTSVPCRRGLRVPAPRQP